MRLLCILSGLAVLLTTAAFAHLLHHYYMHAGDVHNPLFMTGMAVGIVIGVFSLLGAFLLLRLGR